MHLLVFLMIIPNNKRDEAFFISSRLFQNPNRVLSRFVVEFSKWFLAVTLATFFWLRYG